jgi:ribulose-bisphosphate carboxylase large chain
MIRRVEVALGVGCSGVLVNPWLTGLDAMRWLRDEAGVAVMAHPALTGAYLHRSHGIAAPILLGDLFRVAGADAVIYPNPGGRFGLSRRDCETINTHLREPLGELAPSLPTPGGGMDVATAPGWARRYGRDTIFLIGGSLYARGDLTAATRQLREAIDA